MNGQHMDACKEIYYWISSPKSNYGESFQKVAVINLMSDHSKRIHMYGVYIYNYVNNVNLIYRLSNGITVWARF